MTSRRHARSPVGRARPSSTRSSSSKRSVASDLYHRFAEPLPIIDFHSHLRPRTAGHRSSVPFDHRNLARRRSLQVAGDARQRRRRSGDHRQRVGLGALRGVGAHRARHAAQRPLPLDAHGAAGARSPSMRCLSPATAARGLRSPATSGCASRASRCSACSPRSASPWSARRTIRRTRWTTTARWRLAPSRSPPCIRPGARIGSWPSRSPRIQRVDRASRGGSARAVGGRLSTLLEVLDVRHDAFHELGCRASDVGLDAMLADTWTRPGSGRRLRSGACGSAARTGSGRGA